MRVLDQAIVQRNSLWFAATIFVSAFLLFQVQPLIGKFILPWYGGSPAVWTTCMLVFQVLLFAGYAYAHALSVGLSARCQALCHGCLLVAAATLLPITPSADWKPNGSESPTWSIVVLLLRTVGFPYFLLSSTGPLLQRWFCWSCPGRTPYRLYALSNVGSLLALLSYPFVFESIWSTSMQAWVWSIVFSCFAMLCLLCTLRTAGIGGVVQSEEGIPGTQQGFKDIRRPWSAADIFTWFSLAAIPSIMLLATTNQVCMDIAVIPFLWIVPLTIYLLSFILTFDSERRYDRRLTVMICAGTLAATAVVTTHGAALPLLAQISVFFLNLFMVCLLCHGELVRRKPEVAQLTVFYLTIAAGGATGGVFVGLLAPQLFHEYYELNAGILGCVMLCLGIYLQDERFWRETLSFRWKASLAVSVFCMAMAVCMTWAGREEGTLARSRNFYGILRVKDECEQSSGENLRSLVHGRIVHGSQFLGEEGRRRATTYYARGSAVGVAMEHHQVSRPRQIGIVGLGAGTLAVYGQIGDRFRFYEINPAVIELAQDHFSFLEDTAATVSIALGDARLTLEREPPQQFDILILDAFSGDAIPLHLLTAEAMQVYVAHVAENGILAFHISNLHFDLRPVVFGLAEAFGFAARAYSHVPGQRTLGAYPSRWMLLTRDRKTLDALTVDGRQTDTAHRTILWTDDKSNLLQVFHSAWN